MSMKSARLTCSHITVQTMSNLIWDLATTMETFERTADGGSKSECWCNLQLPYVYTLSPNHYVASYLTQTNNLGTTFYAIFMPSRSRSNCIFGLWVKSKILGSSHFALSESDLNALHFLNIISLRVRKNEWKMVFCYHDYSDLLWEKKF